MGLDLAEIVEKWTHIHTNSNSSQKMIIPKSNIWTHDWGNTRMGEIFYKVGGEGRIGQMDIKQEFTEIEPWRRVYVGGEEKPLKKDHKNEICRLRKTNGQLWLEEL